MSIVSAWMVDILCALCICTMSLPVCDASQCSSLLHTPWQSVYTGLSLFIPVGISYMTYAAVKPVLEDAAELDKCSKANELKRSVRSFNWSCVVASALAVVISCGMELNAMRLHKANVAGRISIKAVAKGRRTAFLMATALKVLIFLAITGSAIAAFAVYRKCKKEREEQLEKKLT